ncbi:GlxA family transcriptional regulator [Pseudorhodobacter sp. W20_MBD10_FR17]|uniref:GlxA family transcriptional regulator n=1 Tax=Pseudorhodobacter sp. W20_MBD10_FR17 TaxID=3240266 RepID=UPI003F9BD029
MADTRVVILVETGFVATELALVLDILRIANRLGGQDRFQTQICSSSGSTMIDSLDDGMSVRATPFRAMLAVPPDHVVVLGGSGIRASLGQFCAKFRWLERVGSHILLLSDAAYEWKRLNAEDGAFTTHWENQQLLRDTLVDLEESPPLYLRNGRITTAAGMIATADVVLSEIVAPLSEKLAQATSQMLVMNGVREGNAPQPCSENDIDFLRVWRLEAVIRHMEQNVETPVCMSGLARVAGTSVRQLERRFVKAIGQTPVAFYRTLRLRRGKVMVEQTSASIAEIAIACGFSCSSAFSRVFLREFGRSPTQLRLQLIARPAKPRETRADGSAPLAQPRVKLPTASDASIRLNRAMSFSSPVAEGRRSWPAPLT